MVRGNLPIAIWMPPKVVKALQGKRLHVHYVITYEAKKRLHIHYIDGEKIATVKESKFE